MELTGRHNSGQNSTRARAGVSPKLLRVLLVVMSGAAAAAVVTVLAGARPNGRPGAAYDIPHYLLQARLASTHGMGVFDSAGLRGFRGDRPGFAVLAALLSGGSSTTFIFSIRLLAGLVIGLAAGSFALSSLGEGPFAFPIYVLVVGGSSQVAQTSLGSLDNLLADVAICAAMVCATVAVDGRRGRLLAAGSMAASILLHWFFALLFLLLLAGVTVILLPRSLAARRDGQAALSTPAGRFGSVLAGSIACMIAALVAAPTLPKRSPPSTGVIGKAERLPPMLLPATLPGSALGAGALSSPSAISRRTGLILVGLWTASVPLGLAISAALPGIDLKVFRVAAFALGIPVLIAAAITAAFRLPNTPGLKAVAATLALAASLGLFLNSIHLVRSLSEGRVDAMLEQTGTATHYLSDVAPGRPVIFLSSGPPPRLLDRIARALVPGPFLEDTWIYPGSVDDLRKGRPASNTFVKLEAQSAEWWNAIWLDPGSVLRRDPVIIYLTTYNTLLRVLPEARGLGEGVYLVNGPRASSRLHRGESIFPRPGQLQRRLIALLLVLAFVGLGWAVNLLDASWLARLAVAPAVGLCSLVVGGTIAGRAGVDLTGISGAALVVVVALAGWAPIAIHLVRSRLGGLSGHTPPPGSWRGLHRKTRRNPGDLPGKVPNRERSRGRG